MATPQWAPTAGGQSDRKSSCGGGTAKTEKFVGRKEELSGYVFDITNARNSNNYTRMLKEIARFAGSTSRFGADLKLTMESELLITLSRPVRLIALPANETDPDMINQHEVDMDVYQEDIKNFVKRKSTLKDNMGQSYALVWGQCSQQMRAKVESSSSYPTVNMTSDLLGLLRLIKQSSFDRQTRTMTNEEYHERF